MEKKFPESFQLWCDNFGFARCDGGESVEEVRNRMVCAVKEIAEQHKDGVIFIFSHATSIRVFAAHCLNKSLDGMKEVPWVANASVTKVLYRKEAFELLAYGYDGFMGELATRLPSNV